MAIAALICQTVLARRDAVGLANLALRRPARQSSTSRWSSDRSVVVDAGVAVSGDPSSPRGSRTGEEFFPWWQVDLGEASLLRRVELVSPPDKPDAFQAVTLMGSLDGEAWLPLRRLREASAERCVVAFEPPRLARFVRVRLDGRGELQLRQCLVWGERGDCVAQRAQYAAAAAVRATPAGRSGDIHRVGGFEVFIDEAYGAGVRDALRHGHYEHRERELACRLLRPDDRVIEAGTAIGVAAMTAAAIVGAENVVTFDANPTIVADARTNFARNGLAIDARCAALVPRARFSEGERRAFQVAADFWASRLVGDDEPDAVRAPTLCFEAERERAGANVLICDIEGGEVDLLCDADLSGLRLIILETHLWAVGEERTNALIRKLVLDGFAIDLEASGQGVAALRR